MLLSGTLHSDKGVELGFPSCCFGVVPMVNAGTGDLEAIVRAQGPTLMQRFLYTL